MKELLTLSNDFLEVKICPQAGGSIYSFKYCLDGDMVDVMRPSSIEALTEKAPGKFSSFSLIPYSSIMEDGILKFQGDSFKLYKVDSNEHWGHGEVMYRECKVEKFTGTYLSLSFNSSSFNDLMWPFLFSVLVEYIIEDNRFTMKMSLKNCGDTDMPCGVGIHPYFVRDLGGVTQDVFVKIPMKGVYPGDDQVHTGTWEKTPESEDFTNGKVLSRDHLDKAYCLDGLQYYIKWLESGVKLTFDCNEALGHTVIYCPPHNQKVFALEPVSHCNNAFNMHESGIGSTGTLIVKPGEDITGIVVMTLEKE